MKTHTALVLAAMAVLAACSGRPKGEAVYVTNEFSGDLSVIDPRGNPLGHDTTHGPEAVVRACAETAGTFTLAIMMASGGGDFVSGLWSGAVGTGGGAAIQQAVGEGTCDSPHVLTAGNFTGSTSRGTEESEGEGDCDRSRGR